MRTLLGNYVLMKICPNLNGFLSWWSQFKCSYTYLSHFSFSLQSTVENDSDGFKDQIVAKGRSHMYWMNYDQTFSSITKFDWIQTILYPLATAEDVDEVKIAFLHEQLEGFTTQGETKMFFRLMTSIKWASAELHSEFNEFLWRRSWHEHLLTLVFMLRKPGHLINDGLGRCKDTMTLDKVIHQSCHDCSRSDQRESFKVNKMWGYI
jgi:hypothetical protein